jgi:hypothetical protein
MARFEAKKNRIYQLPTGNSMGFLVAECDTGYSDLKANSYNAQTIVNCLNREDDIKALAIWLLKQRTLHLNADRVELLHEIAGKP